MERNKEAEQLKKGNRDKHEGQGIEESDMNGLLRQLVEIQNYAICSMRRMPFCSDI